MPKRKDINSVLVLGAGQLLSGKHVNLIILAPKHVVLCDKKGFVLHCSILILRLFEISPAAEALTRTLCQILQRGAVIIADYGFGRAEYYHDIIMNKEAAGQ